MKVSIQKKCACNGRLYRNIKAHYKTQKHQMFELKQENKNLRIMNKKQENEIYWLKRTLVVSMELSAKVNSVRSSGSDPVP